VTAEYQQLMTTRTPDSPRRRTPESGSRTVTVPTGSGRRLAYAEYGRSDGVPVVFLHGTPGSRRLGQLLETAAEDVGIRLLAPDRPGYGRSSPRPSRSVRDAGRFVSAVLDDVGADAAGLVAFSGGAPYALATAATRPGRVDRVDVVSGATPPRSSADTPATQRLLAGLATRTPLVLRGLFRGHAWLADRLDPSFVVRQYTAADNAESVPEEVAELLRADFVEAFACHRCGAVTELRQLVTDWGIDAPEIEAPVGLWHGERDTNVPIEGVRRLETRIPTARLHAFDDADHLQTLLRSVPALLEGHR
jgi:pimeloyl-ACP methyl ester carboxylesterase